MSGIRLIPKDENADFPYERAFERLKAIDGIEFRLADLTRVIEVGKRIGWNEELIAAHEALNERGKCFEFKQNLPPFLGGTLYEDNIFFTILDGEHEDLCKPAIIEIADELNVAVLEY